MADKGKRKATGPITFVRQVRAEGNKVTWTTRQETIQATIFVVIMSILIALFLFSADFGIQIFVGWVKSVFAG